MSRKLGRVKKNALTNAEATQQVQRNSFLYSLIHLLGFIMNHRLFPLGYVVFLLVTLVPSSAKIYNELPECEKSTWALICAVTTVIGDVLEMGVIATTMTTNADNCRHIVLWYLLPIMGIDKIIGKFAKSSCQYAVIGELASELMLIYGRFVAVVNSHPTWDVGQKQEVDEYQENLLTEEEKIFTMGLIWAIH